jgi:hypothetical protein
MPSCPLLLYPQHLSPPPLAMRHVWASPRAMATAETPGSTCACVACVACVPQTQAPSGHRFRATALRQQRLRCCLRLRCPLLLSRSCLWFASCWRPRAAASTLLTQEPPSGYCPRAAARPRCQWAAAFGLQLWRCVLRLRHWSLPLGPPLL